MKSARRHELQSNELAETLGRLYRKVQPYLKWSGVGLLAVVVIAVIVGVVSYRRQVTEGRAWAELFATAGSATSADYGQALRDVANVHPHTTAAQWAAIMRADANLAQGTQLLYQSRDEAQKLLREAIELYQQVIPNVRDTYLIQRLEFSRGQAHEALGELRQAESAYNAVVAKGETTALGQLAKRRLEQLAKDDMRKFYDWFVAQRTPVMPKGPANLDQNLPDRPDLAIPGTPSTTGSQGGSQSAPSSPGPETPAAPGEAPGKTTPTPGNQDAGSQQGSRTDQAAPATPPSGPAQAVEQPQGANGSEKPVGPTPEKAGGASAEQAPSQSDTKSAPDAADKPADVPPNG